MTHNMRSKGLVAVKTILALMLIAGNACSVANIVFEKNISKETVVSGDSINVFLTIINFGDEELRGYVVDGVPPYLRIDGMGEIQGFSQAKRFDNVTLPVGENTTLTYKIRVPTVPEALRERTLNISPAVLVDQYGKKYLTSTVEISFGEKNKIKCNFNQACDVERGENYATCPVDCRSGGKDGYCDQKTEGRCDPDCPSGLDDDCAVEAAGTCGNGVCEKTESNITCPFDCLAVKPKTTTLKGIPAAAQKIGYGKIATYIIIIVVLALAVLLVSKAKKTKEQSDTDKRGVQDDKKIEEIKARLQNGEDPKKLVEEGFDKKLVDSATQRLWSK
ncbi:MAG: hypothetical protein ABH834_02275 [Candidatus Altiarchaeota archaeon]